MKSKKGTKFERSFCKLLSLWITEQGRDDLFWRSTTSGARATVRAKQGKKTKDSHGDIMSMSKFSEPFTRLYHWELKRGYSGMDVLAIIDLKSKKPNTLLGWVEKALVSIAFTGQRDFFIVFKRDRKDPCICMMERTYDKLYRKNLSLKWIYKIIIQTDHIPIIIMKLEDFWKWDPKTLFRISRRSK